MEVSKKIESYLSSFKVAETMFKKGVINDGELRKIEAELAKKYGLPSNSIVRIDLISSLIRENMNSGDLNES